MRLRFLAVAVLVILASAGAANAQSCEQGGPYSGCGLCSLYYNVIYDPDFQQTSCNRWGFDPSTERASDGFSCGWDEYYGKISGPTNGWKSIYQFTETQSFGEDFWFSFVVESDDPNASIEVWVGIHPSIWTLVYSNNGVVGCGNYGAYLGHHPEWRNNTLMVVISANVPTSGKHVKIDRVALDQY